MLAGPADADPRILALVRRLCGAGEARTLWKNAAGALGGTGDIDFLAPAAEWPEMRRDFRGWAEECGLGPVFSCRHVPGTLFLIAVDQVARAFIQLDLKERATFRGSTLLRARALDGLTVMDERGFRTLRPGAEGLVKLVASGIAPGGRPKPRNIEKERVRELLAEDPDGARLAARGLGPVGPAALRGARAFTAGHWSRSSMALVEAWFAAGAIMEPARAWERLTAGRSKETCPIVRTSLRHGRRIEGKLGRWLDEAGAAHPVFPEARGPSERPSHGSLPSGGQGMVASVVGPDGSGKTTLIDALVSGPLSGRPIMRIRTVGTLPRRTVPNVPVTEPHKDPVYPLPLSLAKTVYVFADYLLGWNLRVRPFERSGGCVIIERGWWDIAVDPRRYRMTTPAWLLWALGRMLPGPDLVLVLEAPASVVHARKAELSPVELERQGKAWRTKLPSSQKRVYLDAERPAAEVARAAAASIEGLARAAAPSTTVSGPRLAGLPGPKNARWLVPTSPRRAVVTGLEVYHPVTLRGLAGWSAARGLGRLGALGLLPARSGAPSEVLEALAAHVPPGGTIAVAKANYDGRYVALAIGPEGDGLAVAKVAVDEAGSTALEKEGARLEELGDDLPWPLVAPKLLERKPGALILEAISWRPRARPWRLPEEVAVALGRFHLSGEAHSARRLGPSHGDFAPWNLFKTSSGWCLLDWEEAGEEAPPFFDLFHYLVQAHALLGRPSRPAILRGLRGRGWTGRVIEAYSSAAGVPSGDARKHLIDYLGASQENLRLDKADGRAGLRARRALLAALKA